jgi:hypothetical protein
LGGQAKEVITEVEYLSRSSAQGVLII